ncbi:MAG TPA: GvpL/GvpF family gas vesicle protein [Vicinamibacterales bacterium]
MIENATYVYCLVAADRRPVLRRVPRGLPGTGATRLVDVDRGLWLVVADAPLDRYGADAINAKLSDLDWVSRLAVDHEAVVEQFINAKAVLPMKLFTLFSSDQRARDHIVDERRRIDAVLKRVAKRVEWGVRVVLDRSKALATRRAAKPASVSTGVSYLAHKKGKRDAASELATRARTVVTELYDDLAKSAALARHRPASEVPVQGGPLLLDAAFLVPQSKSSRFRTLAERRARALSPSGYRVTVSGPWPPYSFIQE